MACLEISLCPCKVPGSDLKAFTAGALRIAEKFPRNAVDEPPCVVLYAVNKCPLMAPLRHADFSPECPLTKGTPDVSG